MALRFFGIFGIFILNFGSIVQAADFEQSELLVGISKILEVSKDELSSDVAEYANCGQNDPESLIASHGHVLLQAVNMAASEDFGASQGLFADFARQLVVATSAQSACVGLANRWNEADPFLRQSGDLGIGLTRSDLAAAVRLRKLGSGNGTVDAEAVKQELLSLWDSYDSPEDKFGRLFLTRLNAWTQGVEQNWAALSDQGRFAATHVTVSGDLPEEDQIAKILGNDLILEWTGGSSFMVGDRDMSPYDDVITLALSGYFGGRDYEALVARHRAVIAGASSIMLSNQQFGAIGDLMDLNTGFLQ